MRTIALNCPHCGAPLESNNGLDSFFCTFCGGKIILSELSDAAYQARVDIKRLEYDAQKNSNELKHDAEMRLKEYEQEQFKAKHRFKEFLVCMGILLFMLILSLSLLTFLAFQK